MLFKVDLITYRGVYRTVETEKLNIPTSEGRRTILSNHMPIMIPITVGVIETANKNELSHYAINSGVLYFENNVAEIVADSIVDVAEIDVDMEGDGGSCDIVSRGVAKEESYQEVILGITGNAACSGHAECDSIIMDHGVILATPRLKAMNVDASLIHEAAIGKIAGEQLMKLMTLGLSEKEAEETIIQGFLR